jgi:Domain of unknown function (DUF1902)
VRVFEVRAHWDPEAHVWWATSDEVPGLAAEAETLEALIDMVKALVPDLVRLNLDPDATHFPIHVVAERTEDIRVS